MIKREIILDQRHNWSDRLSISKGSRGNRIQKPLNIPNPSHPKISKNKDRSRKQNTENQKIRQATRSNTSSNKKKEKLSLIKKMEEGEDYQEGIKMLGHIRSIYDLKINTRKTLGFKKGDLNLIHSMTYRCLLPDLSKRLVLKKMECLDKSIYNTKIFEIDTLHKLRASTNLFNILKVYSYWNEDTSNPFTYKNIYILTEEAIRGDSFKHIVSKGVNSKNKMRNRTINKFICDLAQGLSIFHQQDVIHGGIRPTNLFITRSNDLVVGEIKKSDLEQMRKTRHLMSRFCLKRYIKHYFIFWAPEVFLDKALEKGSDVWAFGVVTFLFVTGKYPFSGENEEKVISNIININIDWQPLKDFPKTLELLENIFVENPSQRWSIKRILAYCQQDFSTEIQRFWRGILERLKFRSKSHALVRIQALMKSFLVYSRTKNKKSRTEEMAALKIQKYVKAYLKRKPFSQYKNVYYKPKAIFLGRKIRRGYLSLKKDVVILQM